MAKNLKRLKRNFMRYTSLLVCAVMVMMVIRVIVGDNGGGDDGDCGNYL